MTGEHSARDIYSSIDVISSHFKMSNEKRQEIQHISSQLEQFYDKRIEEIEK